MTLNDKIMEAAKERIKTLFHSRELRRIDKNLLDTIENDSLDHDYEINEIKEEIIKNGMLSPISVVGPYPSGRYFVIDGVRRLNAMEFLGDTEIPCYVIECDNLSKKDVMMLALSCNMVKRNDRAAKIAYTEMLCMDVATGQIKDSEVSQILSEATGISLRQARKYKKLAKEGSAEVLDAFEKKEISMADAEVIASHPESEQVELLEKYRNLSYGQKSKEIKKDGGKVGYLAGQNKELTVDEKIVRIIDLSNELSQLTEDLKVNDKYDELLKATKILLKSLL